MGMVRVNVNVDVNAIRAVLPGIALVLLAASWPAAQGFAQGAEEEKAAAPPAPAAAPAAKAPAKQPAKAPTKAKAAKPQ